MGEGRRSGRGALQQGVRSQSPAVAPQAPRSSPSLAPAPRSSLPAASAPPSASAGSGPDWPLSGSMGTAVAPATSAGPAPPPGRADTRREGKRRRRKTAGEKKRGNTVNADARGPRRNHPPFHRSTEQEGQPPETQERGRASGRWEAERSAGRTGPRSPVNIVPAALLRPRPVPSLLPWACSSAQTRPQPLSWPVWAFLLDTAHGAATWGALPLSRWLATHPQLRPVACALPPPPCCQRLTTATNHQLQGVAVSTCPGSEAPKESLIFSSGLGRP